MKAGFRGARRLGYCAGIISESLLYNMYYTYYLVFLTEVAGMEPFLGSTVSLISVLWDAVTDPVIGYLADKKGADKRKFMLRAIFPMGIAFLAAFLPLGDMADWGKFIFYTAVTMAFWLAYTFYTIPYYAVVADITSDYDERTSIRGTSSLINTLAVAAGNIAPALLPALFAGMLFSAAMSWMLTAAIMAAIAVLFGVLTVIALKKTALKPKDAQYEGVRGIKDIFVSFGQVLRLRPVKSFILFVFCFLAASSMLQSNIYYMIVNCVKVPYDDYAPVFIIGLVVTMAAFIPLATFMAKKTDRRTTCIVFFSVSFLGLLVSWFIGLNSIVMLITQPIFMGIASAAFWTLFYSMSYDLVELDEFVGGKRREGIITAFPQLIQKSGSAVGMWLAGGALTLFSYNASLEAQTAATVRGIEGISTLFPAVFLALSILGLILYPFTRRRFDALSDALNKKRAGEEYKTEGFDKLLNN